MREIQWKKIPGYEYAVSTDGQIKRLSTVASKGTGHYARSEKMKRQGHNNKGYYVVDLYADNKRRTFLVHRLVAEAFIPNPDNLPCVNHKDENKRNNNIDNLEWCTHEYNMAYGTRGKKIAEKNGKPVVQLGLNGKELGRFGSALEAQRATGISNANINECCRNKRKTAGGYIWQYAT